MSIDGTTKFPIDTDALKKGDVIAAEAIESIPWTTGRVKRGTDAYGLATLRVARAIEDAFLARGETVTVVQKSHDLRILTDAEASAHNAVRFRAGFRIAGRAQSRMTGVDRSQLPDEATIAKHDRNLILQGRALSAGMTELRRRVLPSEHQRQTPTLKKGSSK